MAPGADAGSAGGAGASVAAPVDLVGYVNGVRRTLPPGRAEVTLLQYLRGASCPFVWPQTTHDPSRTLRMALRCAPATLYLARLASWHQYVTTH